jgi:hypothetical protein
MATARRPSLVSTARRLALDSAPYGVVALYAAAEALVALLVIGRAALLVAAAPIVLLAVIALVRRGRKAPG